MMNTNWSVSKSIAIRASSNAVWKAITDPDALKTMMFGCDVITDWIPGHKILFRGNWNGADFEDKGTILRYDKGKSYSYDYWSNFSGLADVPEHYSIITFKLQAESDYTILNLRQENLANETARDHSDKNWQETLANLKKRLETA